MHPDSPVLQLPTEAGTPFEGGYFVGRIRVGADVYALIVSPKQAGETEGAWGDYGKDVPGARSFFDGAANTLAMAEAGSSIAQGVLKLEINGYSDWHIPSRDELELVYRNLKPTTDRNWRWRGDTPRRAPPGARPGAPAPRPPACRWSGPSAQRPGRKCWRRRRCRS